MITIMRFAVASVVVVVVVTLPLLVLSACKDDPAPAAVEVADAGGGDGADQPLTIEAENFLKSLCSYYEPCCSKVKSADTCIGAAAALARGLQFDGARAKSCLEGLAAESKKQSPTLCARPLDTFACEAVFKKATAKPAGQACAGSDECANEGDNRDGLCLTQKCYQLSRGKDGDACAGTRVDGHIDPPSSTNGSSICLTSDSLYCDTDTSKCKARGAVGATCTFSPGACVDAAFCSDAKQCSPRSEKDASCTSSDECAAGLQCANDGTGNPKCLALEIEGGACIRGDECDPQRGLVCDSGSNKCILDVTVYGLACKGSLALR